MYFSILHYEPRTHTDFCQRSWRALNLTEKHLRHPHEQQLGPCCFVSKPKTKSWKGCDVLSNILAQSRGELGPSSPSLVTQSALSGP